MSNFIDYGNLELNNSDLSEQIEKLYNTINKFNEFEFIEFRTYHNNCDTIIVDCCNSQVSSRNKFGIKNRERLALSYIKDNNYPFEARALREDFPVTLHQNHVFNGEPASLCLYFEPWNVIERSWTPELFLQRILWWLAETSKGTLHRDDQPLEQLYFRSAIEIVLPIDFENKSKNDELVLKIIQSENPNKNLFILRSEFYPKSNLSDELPDFKCIVLSPKPIIQAPIAKFPKTLGELNDQFIKKDSEILETLKSEIKRSVTSLGINSKKNELTLLIINVNIKRNEELEPENQYISCFAINSSFTILGELLGVLFLNDKDKKHYAPEIIGNNHFQLNNKWKNITIEPAEIILPLTKELARKSSSISSDNSNFQGILAGVGALGSALADMWSKESWGNWTFIDNDYLKPHNIIRHIGRNCNIGQKKIDIVNAFTSNNYHPGYINNKLIFGKINDFFNPEIETAIKTSEIVIDVTTTLDVPRDLANYDNAPRSASLFITPSGKSSVLFLEDKKREIRLDSLEAQYYRAVINSSWGNSHLIGNQGNLWIGAGCRDASFIISQELILFHAALLARQTRINLILQEAVIKVWELEDEAGIVHNYNIEIYRTIIINNLKWIIVLDEYIILKLKSLREKKLPKETGGIIIGFIDQKVKKIFIVDILEPPVDSEQGKSFFIRGIDGIKENLKVISEKTANIVEYIGEWHTHPIKYSAIPSNIDFSLLKFLSDNLSKDGRPGLILILGENNYSISLM